MDKTIKEIVAIYISKATSKGHTKATIENKTNLFKRLLFWLGDRELNLDSAEDYLAYLRTKPIKGKEEKGYGIESIRTEVANIKALIRFAFKREYITKNWAEELEKPRKVRAKFEPPARDIVIRAILAGTEPVPFVRRGELGDNSRNTYIKSETRLALLFALDTGLRPGEVFRLKGSDLLLYLPTPKFRIPPSKGHLDEMGIIPPQLLPELKKRVERKRLFEATNDTGNDSLKRGFQAIEVKLTFNATMQKLRHFHASYLIKAGVHPDIVKQILRHKDINTTLDNYVHYYDSELIDAVYKTIPEARATLPIEEKLKYYEEVFNRLGIDKDKGMDFTVDRTTNELLIRIAAK